jgi:hypothetical protein
MRPSVVRARVGVPIVVAAALISGAVLASAQPPHAVRSADDPHQAVIVLLKDRSANPPFTRTNRNARGSALTTGQLLLLSTLRAAGAQDVHTINVLDAIAATVSTGEEAALRADPRISAIVPDAMIKVVRSPGAKPPARSNRKASTRPATVTLPPASCPANGAVQLDPEAVEAIHAVSDDPDAQTARSLGATGAGVIVGDIAGSIDVNTPELIRPDGTHVISDYKDFTGEGGTVPAEDLESFLDDGMIAAQGNNVYNLADYTAHTLSQPCLIRIEGVAPAVTLDAYKVYAANDFTTTSAFLEAIDYAVNVDQVNVLNEEAGSFPMPDTSADLIKLANANAMAAGVTITVPSYDAGLENTIWSPASQPGVISVGASTTFRYYTQSDSAGYDSIGAAGYVSDNISSLSSGGATEQARSIDVVAPGDLDWTICTANAQIAPHCTNAQGQPSSVTQSGGTSEAGPLVAGVAALVIQAYRTTHHGASPTPQLVDQLITSTADDLGVVGAEQGAGLVDAYHAVEAAKSVHTADGSPTAVGDTLLTDTDQLDAIGNPGTNRHFSLRLTNTGSDTQTVALQSRTLGASTVIATHTAILSDGGATYVDAYGYTHNVVQFTFNVPTGASRLDADIANPGTGQSPVDLTLLDPQRLLTGYSLPQGNGNHGHIDLRNPVPGTWTAIITDLTSAQSGYVGSVQFQAAVSSFAPFGTVSPTTATLAPGASTTVHLTVPMPAEPGDQSASLTISSPQAGAGSVPITLRSVIPIENGTGTFTGTVVGGNGRNFVPAQTLFYNVYVPAHQPALDVQLALGNGAEDPFTAYLIAPDGQNPARASDQLQIGAPGNQATISGSGARLHVLAPERGRWALIVTFTNPVTGDALGTPLTGTVSFAPVTATTTGVPTGGVLTAGTPHVVSVTVHNDSDSIESYFLDARLDQQVTLPLTSITPSTGLALPQPVTATPAQWIVPTQTSQLAASVDSTAPVMFDISPTSGEPDLGSTADGDNAYADYTAPTIDQGDWDIVPQPTGPFGDGPVPGSTASSSLTATTQGFNKDAKSPTGDLWLLGVDPQAAFTPVIVQPGTSSTLYLTITPSGAPGSTVTGDIYLDDSSALSQNGYTPTGDELVAIPYHYTVGALMTSLTPR